jgi:glutathionylspermidine synthase
MNEKLAACVRLLDEKIIARHGRDRQLFRQLDEAQRKLGLLSGDRPFCPFARPHFLTRKKYMEISRAAEIIAAAFETMTRAALENEDVMRELDLTEREEEMARIDPGYQGVCNSSRLDSFICGDDFKFLEYNAETPAGIIDQMQIEKVLEMIPEVKEFLDGIRHFRPRPHEKLLAALLADYREFGGRKEHPNIAIVDWRGVSTFTEFEVLKEFFESKGNPTVIADPREMEYDGRVLRAGDFEIDIFYKRVLIHEFQDEFEPDNPFSNAYRDGRVFMANSFRTKIPHKKASLAIASDERFQSLFSGEQIEMIRKHIPWTRRVREMKTVYHGREIDLLEHLRREREKFLLKPNDDYGGSGIVLGWETAESDWERALETALQGSFVAQERAAVEKINFPVYTEDEIRPAELLIDFDPFLFRGRVEGGLVRLSSSALVNVAQGGGETALIVLE